MSRRREDLEVEKRSGMGMAALVWLANELVVSQDAYDRLLLLVGELPKLKLSSFPDSLDAPWYLIFDLLGWKNLQNAKDESLTPQDMDAFRVLAQCYRIPEIRKIIAPDFVKYVDDASHDEYWSQYCDIAGSQWSPQPSSTRPNSLFLLFRDIPLPYPDIEIDIDVELTIRLSRWRNLPHLPHISPNNNDILNPGVVPSIANEAIVNDGTYPNADDLPLWISSNDVTLYTGILRRMVSTLGTDDTIPPRLLDTLRWRFEALLRGSEKVDKTTCLSAPLQYHDALQECSSSLKSFHYVFTVLLARNLNSFVGEERVFRFKEILVMLWACPIGRYFRRCEDVVGVERFLKANETLVMGWISHCAYITYIHEILGHLGMAQAGEAKLGSLWRIIPPQEGDDPRLMQGLYAFDLLITHGVTPEQHRKLINLVCLDLALGPPEAFKEYFTDHSLKRINNILRDPCLRLLAQFYEGSRGDYFLPTSQDVNGPLKNSWARIAAYCMARLTGANSSFSLRLQGLLWPVIPDRHDLCTRALRDTEVLIRLQHMFEHPVACPQHRNIEGHILFHIFEDYIGIHVSVDVTPFTKIPIGERSVDILLAMMAIPENQYTLTFAESLHGHGKETCLAMALEIGRELRASQYSMLAFLSHLPARLIARDATGHILCSEELAGMSMGIINALDLPSDLRVASIIPGVIYGMLEVRETMSRRQHREAWENKAAEKEATVAVNKLMTLLASMNIFGGQNSRILTCARSRETHSPAVGWLPMHTE